MSKTISKTSFEARDLALKGGYYVADAVMATLGTFGTNALLENGNKITNDGYLISNQIIPTIENEFERQGARIAQTASQKTNDEVGDATTTAWGLWKAIVKEAIRFLPNEKSIKAKKTPSEVRKWIEDSKNEVLEKLEKSATPITSKEELIKSAMVSVEDKEIAEILGSMQWELGVEGRIIAEEVDEDKSSIKKVEGIRIDNGFSVPAMVNNQFEQSLQVEKVEFGKIPILLTNYVIGKEEMLKLNESIFKTLISQKKGAIVIIARAWNAEAIKMCQESTAARFRIFPINAPYTNQKEVFKDIEAVVGGRYIDNEESSFDDIYITDVGFIEKLKATQFNAVITGTHTEASEIRTLNRVKKLKEKLIGEKSDFYKAMIETRIAQLTNGFAILEVGGITIVDRQRLKDKCDDAVKAVRLALKGGTVKGAGLAFKEISDELPETNILKRPLTCIHDQIISSAPDDFVIPDWVRDPYLVLKSALENAADVASAMASVTTVVASANPKECYCSKNQNE